MMFSKLSNLKKHVRTVHEQAKSFKCHECGKLFGHKHVLNRHLSSVHKRRLQCDVYDEKRETEEIIDEMEQTEPDLVTPSRLRVLTVLV
jgi:hypothetical protein